MSVKTETPWNTVRVSETERVEWRALLIDAFAVSGMSERAVSEQTGLNRGSLSGVLGGRSVPRTATIEALRKVFDLSADLRMARQEVADRQARPGATPSIYWVPPPGSPEENEPVKWGHMEARFAELDARIARIEQAVINLSVAVDRNDPAAQDAYFMRRRAQIQASLDAAREAKEKPPLFGFDEDEAARDEDREKPRLGDD